MRRWTGFRPSRTSGRARDTMTDMEYSRNERSISSWISMGSMNPRTGVSPFCEAPLPPAVAVGGPPCPVLRRGAMCRSAPSDVEEAHVLRVGLDEVPAQVDILAHEYRADVVGQRGLLHVDLEQGALGRIDGRLFQLLEVHLAQALEALEVVLVVGVLGQEGILGVVVLQVDLLLAHERRVEGR